jgi:hypothetical protein
MRHITLYTNVLTGSIFMIRIKMNVKLSINMCPNIDAMSKYGHTEAIKSPNGK